MLVRPARTEDCAALGRAMLEVVEEGRWLATDWPVTSGELEERFRTAVAEEGHVLLALEQDAELVGAIGLHPTPARGVLSLGMWVVHSHRGRGGGRILLEAALEARPADAHKVELEAFPDNDAAIALYRSFGFEEEGLRRDHYRRRDRSLRSAIVMARLFTERAPR